jgi:membrane protease YdiL (CAAX protease family)
MSDYLQDVEWSLPQVFYVFLAGVVGAFITTAAVLIFVGSEVNVVAVTASFAGQAGGNLIAMWALSATRGTGSFRRDFGLTIEFRHWWAIPAGFGLQIAVVLLTAPLLELLFPDGAPQQEVASLTEETTTLVERLLIVAMVGVAAPVVEEMLFRGMLLSRLVRMMPPMWAVVAQAFLFAAIHLLDPSAIAALPGLMIIGAVLGYAAIRTGNLSLPIMLHAGVNLTAAIILMFGAELTDWLEEVAESAGVEAMLRFFG